MDYISERNTFSFLKHVKVEHLQSMWQRYCYFHFIKE